MNKFSLTCASTVLAACIGATGVAHAQYEGGGGGGGSASAEPSTARNVADLSNRPLYDGSYGAVLGQYRISQDDPVLDEGAGVSALLGYRNKVYGLEAGFGFNGEGGVKLGHFIMNVLVYPLESIPFLYGLVGISASRYQDYPFERSPRPVEGNKGFNTANVQGGLGYIFPLKWNDYEYGLRFEALYRLSDRFLERESDNIPDIAAPDTFKDVLLNVGLQMPLRKPLPVAPVATPEPVRLVEVQDTDGDGVSDDLDQCPGTPRGVRVDSVGCPLPPPPPACGEVRNGGVPSLEGCVVGDSIVLRGVNFDTNKASLAVNAKTLLDDVVADLKKFPDVKVEVGGHTDSRGAADYNRALSERRANSVRDYLVSQGIARDRLSTKGYGLTQPIGDNETVEGQDRNRRVELQITGGSTVQSSPAATSPSPPAALDDEMFDPPLDEMPAVPAATPEPTARPASTPSAAPASADDEADAALDDLFDF